MPDFILIGERLNTHRARFARSVAERDAAAVVGEAQKQYAAGATHLDINAASGGLDRERAEMDWLLDVLLPVLPGNIGLVLDSPHPEVLAAALHRMGRRTGTILNGITANPITHGEMVRLAQTYGAGLIAILTHGTSPARSAEERMTLAEQLRAVMDGGGLPEERQFFDPQVLPVAFDTLQPAAVLECTRQLRARWPRSHALAGISNVSFNLPQRALLNRTYLPMLVAAGADGALCDPCDVKLMEALVAARALLGQDDFLTDYLSKVAH